MGSAIIIVLTILVSWSFMELGSGDFLAGFISPLAFVISIMSLVVWIAKRAGLGLGDGSDSVDSDGSDGDGGGGGD